MIRIKQSLLLVYLMWIGIALNSTVLVDDVPIKPNMGLIAEDNSTPTHWVNFQVLQSPISEHTSLLVIYLEFLGQLDFILILF